MRRVVAVALRVVAVRLHAQERAPGDAVITRQALKADLYFLVANQDGRPKLTGRAISEM